MRDMFVFEGALCDRDTGETIRGNYAAHTREIRTGQDLRSTLRAGEYAWPGGYQLAMVTDDGGLLCFDCCRENLTSVIWSIRNEVSDGWRVIGCDVIYDGESETGEHCDHCGRQLAEAAE